jgi:hypothetical protein
VTLISLDDGTFLAGVEKILEPKTRTRQRAPVAE